MSMWSLGSISLLDCDFLAYLENFLKTHNQLSCFGQNFEIYIPYFSLSLSHTHTHTNKSIIPLLVGSRLLADNSFRSVRSGGLTSGHVEMASVLRLLEAVVQLCYNIHQCIFHIFLEFKFIELF